MAPAAEAAVARMRQGHPNWGARRLVFELGRASVDRVPSESAVYRALVLLNLIDPARPRNDLYGWGRVPPWPHSRSDLPESALILQSRGGLAASRLSRGKRRV